jgi:hypothetical protein
MVSQIYICYVHNTDSLYHLKLYIYTIEYISYVLITLMKKENVYFQAYNVLNITMEILFVYECMQLSKQG